MDQMLSCEISQSCPYWFTYKKHVAHRPATTLWMWLPGFHAVTSGFATLIYCSTLTPAAAADMRCLCSHFHTASIVQSALHASQSGYPPSLACTWDKCSWQSTIMLHVLFRIPRRLRYAYCLPLQAGPKAGQEGRVLSCPALGIAPAEVAVGQREELVAAGDGHAAALQERHARAHARRQAVQEAGGAAGGRDANRGQILPLWQALELAAEQAPCYACRGMAISGLDLRERAPA